MAVPKHLRGIAKGKPVAITPSGMAIYRPSAKIDRELNKAIRDMKAGKTRYVLLKFDKKRKKK